MARNRHHGANGRRARADADELNRVAVGKDQAGDRWPNESAPGSVLPTGEKQRSIPGKQWNNTGATRLALLFG